MWVALFSIYDNYEPFLMTFSKVYSFLFCLTLKAQITTEQMTLLNLFFFFKFSYKKKKS